MYEINCFVKNLEPSPPFFCLSLENRQESVLSDPRVATEDELRAFINEFSPEDFNVTARAFMVLPNDVQYKIVGYLHLKSRQT